MLSVLEIFVWMTSLTTFCLDFWLYWIIFTTDYMELSTDSDYIFHMISSSLLSGEWMITFSLRTRTRVLFTYLNPCSAFLKEYQKICILLIPTQAAKCLMHGFNSTNQGQRKVTDQFQEYSNRICCSLCLISLDPLTDRNDS